jgi:hypothetical protein
VLESDDISKTEHRDLLDVSRCAVVFHDGVTCKRVVFFRKCREATVLSPVRSESAIALHPRVKT